MFRVFNRIRKQLVADGRMLRYLGYALGEIVLIVAGILIALQINDWAEDRNDRRFERKTLAQIRQNLQADHAALTEILGKRQRAMRSIDRILAIENPDDPGADLDTWLADVMQFDRFNSISNAYDVLKSHGLDLVRNDELRLTLGIYYDSWAREIQAHNRDIEVGFFDRWIPVIIADIEDFEWAEYAEPYDTSRLLGNRTFVSTLKLEQGNHQGAAENLEKMIRINERLQELIDAQVP